MFSPIFQYNAKTETHYQQQNLQQQQQFNHQQQSNSLGLATLAESSNQHAVGTQNASPVSLPHNQWLGVGKHKMKKTTSANTHFGNIPIIEPSPNGDSYETSPPNLRAVANNDSLGEGGQDVPHFFDYQTSFGHLVAAQDQFPYPMEMPAAHNNIIDEDEEFLKLVENNATNSSSDCQKRLPREMSFSGTDKMQFKM